MTDHQHCADEIARVEHEAGAELARLRALLVRAREALEKTQTAISEGLGDDYCPVCFHPGRGMGRNYMQPHKDDCIVGRVLADLDAALEAKP